MMLSIAHPAAVSSEMRPGKCDSVRADITRDSSLSHAMKLGTRLVFDIGNGSPIVPVARLASVCRYDEDNRGEVEFMYL